MPAVQVLDPITRADPLFGLIYYVLGGWPIFSAEACLSLSVQVQSCYWRERLKLLFLVLKRFACPENCGRSPVPPHSPEDHTILELHLRQSAITWINSILYMQDPAGTVALNKEWYQVVNIPMDPH
ncbi:hypothetical protein C8R45DRAFT_944213 [Mycena sanguinolenta]|nr:hypothetical protein C8R45DRAFT_944213 [Mycena sanguinolenta]